jgi:hypothetical protein
MQDPFLTVTSTESMLSLLQVDERDQEPWQCETSVGSWFASDGLDRIDGAAWSGSWIKGFNWGLLNP